MARGEPEERGERGPGIAVFASFGVVCLAALLLVLWTTHACESRSWVAPPGIPPAPEPFAGADAALVPLGSRGCLTESGPAVAPAARTASRSRIESSLAARGYVPADAWSTPTALPFHGTAAGLEGSCGVVAVAGEPGAHVTGYRSADGPPRTPCVPNAALVPACEGETVEVQGTGDAVVRTFLLPGLTAEAVARSGMPASVVLAHAEAEAQLRAVGWEPADEVVRVAVTAGSTHSGGPPAAPTSGCIGWVAVSDDLGNASTWWAHRQIDQDPTQEGLVAGLVACAPDPAAVATETRLDAYDAQGGGGTLWYRPYAPAVGPAVRAAGEAPGALGAGSMRVVRSPPSTLPASVPMDEPPNPAP